MYHARAVCHGNLLPFGETRLPPFYLLSAKIRKIFAFANVSSDYIGLDSLSAFFVVSSIFQCSARDVLLQYINAVTFDSRYFLLEINGFTFDTRRSFVSNERIKYQRCSNLSLLNWKAGIRINRINRCCKTCISVQRKRDVCVKEQSSAGRCF